MTYHSHTSSLATRYVQGHLKSLVPSASPHIKVILPPISTSQEVTLFSFLMEMEVTKNKKKLKSFFLLLISCHQKYVCISKLLLLLYLTLTLLGYCLLGVKLDNRVATYALRSPPRLTVFNRHPLSNNPVTYVWRLTALV